MIYLKWFIFICLYELSVSADEDQANMKLEEKYYDLNKASELFEGFIKTYNKEYRDRKEYNYRFEVFIKTLKRINDGSLNSTKKFMPVRKLSGRLKNVPESWDWRSKGIVTPVKDQHSCSSCWAFSAVACVESQYAKKHGDLLSLSEQQLVDCYTKDCKLGGYPDRALNYAAKMGGFMLKQAYPYRSNVRRCRLQSSRVKVKVRGGKVVSIRNEDELKALVYSYGPVSAGIVTGTGFSSYKKGIATARKLGCVPQQPGDHAVVIVGYGTENGVPYWIIKNSHGTGWGEKGYIRIVRGVNTCGILEYIAIADVV